MRFVCFYGVEQMIGVSMRRIVGYAGLVWCAGVANAQPVEWLDARSGFWDDASRWSSVTAPDRFDDVRVDVLGFYSVLVDGVQSVRGIELLSSYASLELLSGSAFTISGDVTNNALIVLNPKLSEDDATLELDGDITFSGTGELRLNALDGDEPILETRFISHSFTNGVGHTVSGGGRITADFTNRGFWVADLPLTPLLLKDLDATNESSMRVKSGCTLSLDFTHVTQGAGGLVEVVGPGAELHMRGRLTGGRVATLLGGVVRGDGGVFEGVDVGDQIEMLLENSLLLEDCVLQDTELILDGPGTLHFEEGTQLLGSGVIRLESSGGDRTHISTSFESDVESDYTIRGAGKFRSKGRFVNRSRFLADVEGEVLELHLSGDQFLNEFELRSSMGGVLYIHGFIAQGPNGSVISGGSDSVVDLSGATIKGGRVTSVVGGQFVCDKGNLWLNDVVFDADIDVSGYISVSGRLTNSGTMKGRLASTSEGMVLDGTGEIVLLGGTSNIGYPAETQGIFNGSQHTISGSGMLRSPLVNAGLISADVFGETLEIEGFDVLNSGVIQAISGARVDLEARVEQVAGGEIRALGPGSEFLLRSPGGAISREFVGGTIRTSSGGLIRLADRTVFRDVHVDGDVLFDAFGFMDMEDGVTLDGTMIIDPVDVQFFGAGILVDTEEMIQGNGVIRLVRDDSFSILANDAGNVLATFGPGIRIEGLGVIRSNMVTHGTLAPGLPVGAFNVEAPIVMTSDATLEIEVGESGHDRVMSNSAFLIAGTLDLRFVDGFQPSGFWSRSVLDTPEINGGFEQIVAPDAPAGYVTRVYSTGTELLVGQTCLADINLDGAVNFFDVSEFIRLYQEGWSGVDLNGDGTLNFFDATAFIVGYQQGCP